MANPNKTVGNWRRKTGGLPERAKDRPRSAFMTWFFEQVQTHGRMFASMEAAQAEFDKAQDAGKPKDGVELTAEHGQD